MLRRQLPVYSPITLDAVLAGAASALSSGRARAAREALVAYLSRGFGASDVLLTDSGTSALRLAIAGAASLRPALATALPAYCCYDVATAADGADVPVALYDLDPRTLAPRPESLERALERGVSSVVVAHLYGQPVDVDAVARLAGAAGALVIEDAAQGIGATLRGVPLASFGSVSVLSLGRGKGWTGGSGGALLAHDERGAAIVARARHAMAPGSRGMADVARLGAQLLLGQPSLYGLPASLPFLHLGETIYRPASEPRAASRASVGAAWRTCELLERETELRKANGTRLLAAARASEKVRVVESVDGASPGYLRLPVLRGAARGAIGGRAARLGIAAGYPLALCDLAGFKERVKNRDEDFSGARELAARLATLPTHSRLSQGDIAALEGWLAVG
ncbi:MAG TPA: DegT/DnrJ/EryC1/StrS family aminotransferase [Gemmatimonadales bacterium]|nr:DegT/DnrJ/EryC1/StrS family aminotransferase [Gemmatimonadales bacterium]